MAEIKDGGPAFPHTGEGLGTEFACTGLTVRDYMAAKAMQGTLADPNVIQGTGSWEKFCDNIATESYEIADAMLRAREVNHG